MLCPTRRLPRNVPALLLALATLAIGARSLHGQTTFDISSTGLNSSSGASASLTMNGSLYEVAGTTTNNITPLTFGQSFTINSTQNGLNTAFSIFYDGTQGGSTITNGSSMPISYNFTLDKNAFIVGSVTWTLKFSDPKNGSGGNLTNTQTIATGTLSSASQTFSGSGVFNFNNGYDQTSGTTIRAQLDFAFTSDNTGGTGQINATMGNTGFGGQGISLNVSAIPEPSTYAAIAGASMLGLAVWQRRRKSSAVALRA